jgi:hypothetical protein
VGQPRIGFGSWKHEVWGAGFLVERMREVRKIIHAIEAAVMRSRDQVQLPSRRTQWSPL